MVAKKAEGRYPNMTQLLVDLEKCCRGNETTLVFPERVGPASEFGQANLLDSGSIRDAQPVVRIKPASSKSGKKPFLLIGTVVIGVLILLAGLVVKVKTKDGTLVVTVNEPDAQVEVLNEEGKVEISQKGGKGTISISVDPGKHRLKVTKDGFTVFGQDIEIEAGDKQPITAKLVPLEEKLVVVGTGWHGWPTDAPKPAIAPFDAAQAKKHQEAWATYLKVPVEYTNSLGMKFRLIPPGEFLMGTPQEEIEEMITLAPKTKEFIECIQREIPQHKVILTEPFFLGIHEVTQAQYENLIGHNPSGFAATGVHKDMFANIDTASHPVEMVNWHDAVDFCIKLSGREKVAPAYFRAGDNITLLKGAGYQLPTEARWEFACRAGTTTKFWCGDRTDSVLQIAWIFANSGQRTHSVGLLEANPFGLHDTTGNVWEWCENWVSPAEQFEIKTGPKIDPRWALGEGTFRSGRGCDYRYRWVGGGESGYFGFCRPAFRGCWGPSERHDANGFRVSLSVDAVRQRQLPEATSGKKPLFFETPGFDTWAKEVAAMTAEQQLEAVSKKLVELNPEFDGMLTNSDFSPNSTPHIVNQVVLGVGFVTDQITDISPVRALVGLIGIVANGSEPNKGKLVDLSPLQGMRLEGLGIRYNQICDLQPLEGMPLSGLHLGNNQISDLSILKSMPLRSLNIVGTKVSDLFPIRELPLTAISLDFKPEQHTEILRSIKTLETINDKPAAEFWKEVEEQQMRKKLDQ